MLSTPPMEYPTTNGGIDIPSALRRSGSSLRDQLQARPFIYMFFLHFLVHFHFHKTQQTMWSINIVRQLITFISQNTSSGNFLLKIF